jgi:ubiquitin-conjugating enzyme E2 D/E
MERIIEEFNNINRNPISNCGITVGLKNVNDYRIWKVTLLGPKDTSYKGGFFFFQVEFPEDYPLKPPKVYFLTPIYHLNVNPRAPRSSEDIPLGHISLSTLSWWKPEYTMKEVFINIFALLYKANPDSPYGLDRADEYKEKRSVYEAKIEHFTKKYANCMRPFKQNPTEDWDFSIS